MTGRRWGEPRQGTYERSLLEKAWAKSVPVFNKRIEPSVWSRHPTGFSWQARPAFFSVFWKSEWR